MSSLPVSSRHGNLNFKLAAATTNSSYADRRKLTSAHRHISCCTTSREKYLPATAIERNTYQLLYYSMQREILTSYFSREKYLPATVQQQREILTTYSTIACREKYLPGTSVEINTYQLLYNSREKYLPATSSERLTSYLLLYVMLWAHLHFSTYIMLEKS